MLNLFLQQHNIYEISELQKVKVKEGKVIYLQLIGTAFWFGHTIPGLKKPVQFFVAYSRIWNAS